MAFIGSADRTSIGARLFYDGVAFAVEWVRPGTPGSEDSVRRLAPLGSVEGTTGLAGFIQSPARALQGAMADPPGAHRAASTTQNRYVRWLAGRPRDHLIGDPILGGGWRVFLSSEPLTREMLRPVRGTRDGACYSTAGRADPSSGKYF